jgi:hypothetical protein
MDLFLDEVLIGIRWTEKVLKMERTLFNILILVKLANIYYQLHNVETISLSGKGFIGYYTE